MYKVTLGIDGMMCGMCEAHVNDVIRKNFDIKKVKSSHSKNETIIISKEELIESKVKEVLDPTGYRLLSFKIEPFEKKGLFK
ncbi:MAG: cation transporter [Gammaproteobacteria bacterium]|nr:cation transporter [Gammaproteobacteria bacterium]